MKLATIVLSAVLAAGGINGAAEAADKLKVVTATTGIIFSTVYVAQQLGYFKAEGLDVDIVDGNGGSNAVASVVGGSAQIAFVGIKNASQAVTKGQPLKIVATGIRGFPQTIVLNKQLFNDARLSERSSLAERGAVLRNRVVAVSDIGGSTGDFVRFALKQADIPADQVKLVNITSIPAQLAALKTRRIDAFVNASPATEIALADGYGAELVAPARHLKEAADFEYTVQVAHGDFVKSRPDLIERYFRGLQKALDLIRSDPQAAKNAAFAFLADQAATSSAYPDAIRDAAWKNTLPYFPDTVALDRKKLSAARAFFDISDKAPDSVLVDNSIALKLAATRPAIVSAK